MLISVKALKTRSLSEIKEYTETLDRPIIIIDNNNKIMSRNKAAVAFSKEFHLGCSFSRRLSPETRHEFESLNDGETVTVEYKLKNGYIDATVIVFNDFKLAVFRPIESALDERVGELYSKLSGYDSVVNINQSETEPLPQSKTMNLFKDSRTALAATELFSRMHTAHSMPFFNTVSIARTVFEEFNSIHSTKYRLEGNSPDVAAKGSEKDLAVAITFLLSFLTGYCRENSQKVGFEHINGDSRFRFEGESLLGEAETQKLCSPYRKSSDFHGNRAELLFCFHLLKLIADANLWDLEISVNRLNTVSFTLTIPSADPLGKYVLRDIDHIFVALWANAFI